jgi:hypothetical protein
MTALFGLLACVFLDAPWYYYLIGFLCVCLDARN